MKYYNKIKQIKTLIAFVFVSLGLLSSCEEDLKLGNLDESKYETPEQTIGYLMDENGEHEMSTVEFRQEGELDIYMSLTNTADQNATVAMKYDSKVFEDYNAENDTDFELLPEELVTLGSDLEIEKGAKKSEKTTVKFVTDPSLDSLKTYVIPISTELKSGNITLAEKESKFLILVKDFSKVPTADKSTGIEIISCMEVNDTNPLNNLCFTLKSNNKPLIDQVILFSSNINYNNETGKVYVLHNPNVQHILDNRDKYIKPLQNRGIKVLLSILGNHDRSGVANLADETARAFAQELKAVCDAYNLDGVFFDDEYSSYQRPAPAGFVEPSNKAAARLCYETKMAMPEKIVSVYVYSRTRSLPSIDGKQPGEFIDYGIHDYGAGSDLSSNYPGLSKDGMAMYSQEFSRGYFAADYRLESLRNNGYGAHMIFAMDPFKYNYNRQESAMQLIADKLFDDELVVDENFYSKDW